MNSPTKKYFAIKQLPAIFGGAAAGSTVELTAPTAQILVSNQTVCLLDGPTHRALTGRQAPVLQRVAAVLSKKK